MAAAPQKLDMALDDIIKSEWPCLHMPFPGAHCCKQKRQRPRRRVDRITARPRATGADAARRTRAVVVAERAAVARAANKEASASSGVLVAVRAAAPAQAVELARARVVAMLERARREH